MTDYIYAFLLTAVAAAIVELLAPVGEGGRLGGVVRFAVGLCLLVMLLNPLREGISLLRSIADGHLAINWEGEAPVEQLDYDGILQDELSDLGRSEVEAWVSATLAARFGIPAEHHTVTVSMAEGAAEDGGLPALTGITILLHGSSVFENPHQIESYFTDQLGCPCAVAINIP